MPTSTPAAKFVALTALLGSLALSGCKSNEARPEPPPAQAAPAAEVAPVAALPECKEEPAKPAKGTAKTTSKTAGKTDAKAGSKTEAKGTTTKNGAKAEAKAPAPEPCQPPTKEAAKPAEKNAEKSAIAAAPSSGGYDLSKNKPVVDSAKVQAGDGTRVKGINDWEGEITGLPAANSRFTKLRIGMPLKQVTDLAGEPTDQGAYVTGKAFIPFYFGSDRTRWEAVYKGQGRLIFAGQAGFDSGHHLVWIIHNSNEPGYR